MITTRELEDIIQEIKELPEAEDKQRENVLTVRRASSLVDEYLALIDKSEHMHMARYLELRTVIFYELGRKLHWKEVKNYRELPDEYGQMVDILKHMDEEVAHKTKRKYLDWAKFDRNFSLLKAVIDDSTNDVPDRTVFVRINGRDELFSFNGQALLDKLLYADMYSQNGMRTMTGERFFAARYDKMVLDHLEELQKKSIVSMTQTKPCIVTYKPYWWFGEKEEITNTEVTIKSSRIYDRYMWQGDDGIRTPYAMKAMKAYYNEKYKRDREEVERQLAEKE